jgi:cytochrome c-type biogenesis protein CcmE
MSHKAARLAITAAVLAIAFGTLLYVSLGNNLQYYKFVDEVMTQPAAWEGKPIRIHGYVVPGSIGRKPGSREYRFDVQRNGKVVRAYFTGTPPDGFKNDSEVVLTGVLTERGSGASAEQAFVTEHMEAKCPSKYEERPAKAAGL